MAEVRLVAPLRATLIEGDLMAPGTPPGGFRFWCYGTGKDPDAPSGLNFLCPCGCRALYGIKWRQSTGAAAGWTWDGNREAPTCSPSVLGGGTDGPHWHGFLRAGFWIQA